MNEVTYWNQSCLQYRLLTSMFRWVHMYAGMSYTVLVGEMQCVAGKSGKKKDSVPP